MILVEEWFIFTPDFIILAVNSFTSELPITLWGYQFDPFMNLSHSLFNLKLLSYFKLNNKTNVISDFIPSKLPTINDVPIINFM